MVQFFEEEIIRVICTYTILLKWEDQTVRKTSFIKNNG